MTIQPHLSERQKRYLNASMFFILVTVAFYLLDRFALLIEDDYHYMFKYFWCGDQSERISSLKDIVESQWVVYLFGNNGRFVIHSLVQFFCGIAGIRLLEVINSLMFGLLCLLSVRLALPKDRDSLSGRTLLVVMLWFMIPMLGKTYLGDVSFSINYLWSSTAMVAFLLLHEHQRKQTAKVPHAIFKNTGLLLTGIICGSLQESFCIPIAGALFFYHVFNFKQFRGSIVWLTVGFWAGALFLTAAPGNFLRFSTDVSELGGSFLSSFIKRSFTTLTYMRATWLLIVAILIAWIKNKAATRMFITSNALLLWAVVVNLLFMCFVGMGGRHQLVCVELLSIIILLKFLFAFKREVMYRYKYLISIPLLLLLAVTYIRIYQVRETVFNTHEEFVEGIRNNPPTDGVVIGCKFDQLMLQYDWGRWTTNYYYYYQAYSGCRYNKLGLSNMLTGGKNHNLITSVLPMSAKEMVEECVPENSADLGVEGYKLPNKPYYVIPLDRTYNKLQIKLNLTYNKMPVLLSRIRKAITGKVSQLHFVIPYGGYYNVETFDYNGRSYVVIADKYIDLYDLYAVEVEILPEPVDYYDIYRERFLNYLKKKHSDL